MNDSKLLSRAVETSPTLVLIADARGNIVYVNARWTEVTGLAAERVVGLSPGQIRSTFGDLEVFEGLWEAVLRGAPWRGRTRHRAPGGSQRVFDTVITLLDDGAGGIENFVSVGLDVTEIAQVQDRLATVDKWQAIGQFAGGIAHDLNNHLGVVLTNAEIALARTSDDDHETREDLEGVIASARSGKELVQAVLASSRRSRIRDHPRAVGDELRAAVDLLEETAAPSTLHLSVRPGLPIVSLDSSAFRQVLVQLVANARDAMGGGGEVRVYAGPFFVDDDFHARHTWCPLGPYAEIRVEDRGEGMTEAVRSRAFDMFYTTRATSGASGLGLPVAFGLMKQHDGFMLLDSEPGAGTTVRLLFPAAEAIREPAVATRESTAGNSGRTVLLVEDNQRLRRAGRRALEDDGWAVVEAVDGVDALEKYAAAPESIDLVISDLMMPRIGGSELYRRLVEQHGPLPFIITSGHVDEDPQHRDGLPAEVPYLLKPWGVDDLSAAARRALGDPATGSTSA